MAKSGSQDEQEQLLLKLPNADHAAFDSRLWEHDPLCLPNTRVDLLKQIITWSGNPDAACIFWLNGMAGTGKTTIARTVARTCANLKRLGASFFFSTSQDDLNHATKFFTTIAVQLASNIPALQPCICKAIRENHNISHLSVAEQWKRFIFEPLSNLRELSHLIILVIDALDECQGANDIQLILRLLSQAATLRTARLRIFLTSRPEIPIRLGFHHIPHAAHQDFILHNISESIIQHDMMIFVCNKLENIRNDRSLPEDWPGQDNVELLVRKADKLFLYASTVCRFVHQSTNPRKYLSHLLQGYTTRRSPTGELDAIYTKIIKHFVTGDFEEELSERFKQIVGSIILLSDPLSAEALAKLLHVDEWEVKDTLDSLRSVLDVSESQDCDIRLIHPSFRDFLLDPQRCSERQFWIDKNQIHGDLFASCIKLMSKHLKRDMCNLKVPGALASEVKDSVVENCLSLDVQYACLYWVHHLRHSNVILRDNDRVHTFLQKHFLHWLEALSLIGGIFDSALVKQTNISKPNSDLNHELRLMVYDAKRFVLNNCSTVEYAPLQLYCSALVFSPLMSKIKIQFRHQVLPWIKNRPAVQYDWGPSLQTLEGHGLMVCSVAFSPDGQLLASASFDNKVLLWDLSTGATIGGIHGHSSYEEFPWVSPVMFSPDSKLLASGSHDGTVRLWDPFTVSSHGILEGHSSSISAVAFSPDGNLLASGSYDKTIMLWDPLTGATHRTINGHSDCVSAVAFSPDSRLLASGSHDHTVRLWDTSTGALCGICEGHCGKISSVSFSPVGKLLATGSLNDNTVRLWDAFTGAAHRTIKTHSIEPGILAVVFSPNGQFLAAGSHDNKVILWDPSTGGWNCTLDGHTDEVLAVTFSPDSLLLASGSRDRTIRLWDLSRVTSRGTAPDCHSNEVLAMAFSPDGQLLASGSDDSIVRLWDPSTGELCGVLEGHSNSVMAVAFSQNGQLLASGSFDRTIRLWDLSTRAALRIMKVPNENETVIAVAFPPDGQLLASISESSTVSLFDLSTGALHDMFNCNLDKAWRAVFSPDGQLFAVVHDKIIQFWDIKTKQKTEEVKVVDYYEELTYTTDDSSLQTFQGILDLKQRILWESRSQSNPRSCGLRVNGYWVKFGADSILWLPADYRVSSQSVQYDVLALGHKSGRVTFVEFDRDNIPLGESFVSGCQQII
ncbi:WD40-repeat-containing domain protein [Trichophaea hybrida]|nr:WD40-repeat-containing domain protein [Trichophaea hybrida]